MDIKALDRLASIISGVRDFNMIKQITDRCLYLLEAGCIPRNDDALSAFCGLVKKLYPFLSHSAVEKISNYILDLTQSMSFESQSMDTFVTVIDTAFMLTPYEPIAVRKQIIDAGKLHLFDRINDCQPVHLQELSHWLRVVHQYDDATRKVIDTRIKNLVEQGNISFSDVFELYGSLSRRSEPQLVKLLEQLMEKIVSEVDLDKVLVWKLAMALHNVDSTNIKLIMFVQSKAAECDLGNKWIPFLTQKEFVNQKHKKVLTDSLFSKVEANRRCSNHLARIYLLAHMLPLHDELYVKLSQLIDTWGARELAKFLEGLIKWQQQARVKHWPPNNKQIDTLLSKVCQNIINKLDVSDLRALGSVSKSLSAPTVKIHCAKICLQTLMDQFWSSTRLTIVSANPRSLEIILACCIFTRYFNPELSDYVSEAVVNIDQLQHTLFLRLFHYLGQCGYTPQNMEALMPKAFWLLEELDKTDSLMQYLQTIMHLVLLDRVPENELISIFTTEFLQRLQAYLLVYPEKYHQAARYLVFLNQCAVIDYPHLNIPWYSDKVGKMYRDDKFAFQLYQMIVIEQAVGGMQYFKAQTMTDYCHRISFELLMDNENNLIAWNRSNNSKNIQRIAVIIEGVAKACLVPKGAEPRLGAKLKREISHMQKLGYKVVAVPFYEWKGKTQEEYVELLQQKLVQQGDENYGVTVAK